MATPIVFSIFQTQNHSNGGVNSMTQILEADPNVAPVILTNIHGPFNKRWEKRKWPIYVSDIKWGSEVKGSNSLSKLFDLLKSNFKAFKLLRAYKTKTLYCNDIQGFWCAYFGGKLAGSKIIFNLRDTKSASELSSLKKWSFIARNSDIVVVLSEEMKDFVVNKLLDGKDEHKVRVTYSIVDHQLFFPISASDKEKERIKLGYKPTDFIVGYVAAFNEKKAQLAFLEKLVIQFKSRSNILFCFIGDFNPDKSEYAKACLDIVKQLGIEDKVKFIGHVSNVDQFYKISDLSAIASNKEGLARCMIESISCGTPVISFDVCSAHEILTDHKCGEVAGMDNYDQYYQKMVKLIDDQALLKRYGENGVALSNTLFDKKVVLSKYQEIY